MYRLSDPITVTTSDAYHPLQIEGRGERVVFQTYEYLPANSSTLQLLK